MSVHLKKEVDKLNRMVMLVAAEVEKNLVNVITALREGDAELADKVVKADVNIDQLEVETEEECLKTLALYQPVANDLRYIVAVLKINNDLERIGDLAANIAKSVKNLKKAVSSDYKVPDQIFVMGERIRVMLREGLNSLVNLDTVKAISVCESDNEVDKIYYEMYDYVIRESETNKVPVGGLLQVLIIARYMERIADHATNIAEDVYYLVKGEINRHNRLNRE